MNRVFRKMKHTRTLRGGAAVALAAAMITVLLPGAQADISGGRSETVYAVLGNDGSFTGATVVNCFAEGGNITDYGVYTSIQNLSGSEEPVTDGDQISWNAPAGSPFYYQAIRIWRCR